MRCAALVLLGSCAPGRLLVDLPDAKVSIDIVSTAGLDVPAPFLIHVDVPGCVSFDDRLHASVNGRELVFTEPEGSGDGCIQAGAATTLPPTLEPIVVTMADPSDTWTFVFPSPFPALEIPSPVIAGEEVAVVWPGALPLVYRCARVLENGWVENLGCTRELLAKLRIDAETNSLRVLPVFPARTATLEIQLASQAEITGRVGHVSHPRCDGPASCSFLVKTSQLLDVVVDVGP